VAREIPVWLYEAVWERVKGFREYKWQVSMTVPAGSTVDVVVRTPPDEVWLEYGYEFEPEVLDMFEFSHYHDGREIYRDLLLGESELSLPYTKPEMTVDSFVVYVKNTDTVNRSIKLLAYYRRFPKRIYETLYQQVAKG